MMLSNVGIIILAAGVSKRLGRAKQLEIINGKSLLQHTIDVAIGSNVQKIVVVLGARFNEIKSQIQDNDIVIAENENWEQGMSTSIVFGLSHIVSTMPEIDKVIFMVCDQPYVNTELLQALIQKSHETKHPIVASEYAGIKGIPALFDKEMFASLMQLEGEGGAGKLIRNHLALVATVPFDKGEVDVDSEDDVEKLTISKV
jgi:molybdenum cofactor cytidylyltransferase